MGWFRHWREQRIIRQKAPDAGIWQSTLARLPVLRNLSAGEQAQLKKLTTLFLDEKTLEPVAGLTLSPADRLYIGVQACLPILVMGLNWYRGWSTIIVYPDSFIGRHAEVDSAGVVHEHAMAQSGESWERGPLILSLADVLESGQGQGYNVVIHELAHKLDMLNEVTNGCPPLHGDMAVADWSKAFQDAYDDMRQCLDGGLEPSIDSYATESPAECFAVFSEYFFERPALVNRTYPAVYEQLRQFYRQDPLLRLPD